MANYRKILSVDDEMLINAAGDTAVLFVNQRTGEASVAKRPVVLKGKTPDRLRRKMQQFLDRCHAPVV